MHTVSCFAMENVPVAYLFVIANPPACIAHIAIAEWADGAPQTGDLRCLQW